jgi:hypothetical protein
MLSKYVQKHSTWRGLACFEVLKERFPGEITLANLPSKAICDVLNYPNTFGLYLLQEAHTFISHHGRLSRKN